MVHLAELNENGICIGTKTVKEFINDGHHVEVESPDFVNFSWRKYQDGTWSSEKFEPTSTAPLTEFEQLKSSTQLMEKQISDLNIAMAQMMGV